MYAYMGQLPSYKTVKTYMNAWATLETSQDQVVEVNILTNLNENILIIFELFAVFFSRIFCKLLYAVNNTLIKKLNKFRNEPIVPVAVA